MTENEAFFGTSLLASVKASVRRDSGPQILAGLGLGENEATASLFETGVEMKLMKPPPI